MVSEMKYWGETVADWIWKVCMHGKLSDGPEDRLETVNVPLYNGKGVNISFYEL